MMRLSKSQVAVLINLCREPGLPRWHYLDLKTLPPEFYQIKRPRTAMMFASEAYPTKAGLAALAKERGEA